MCTCAHVCALHQCVTHADGLHVCVCVCVVRCVARVATEMRRAVGGGDARPSRLGESERAVLTEAGAVLPSLGPNSLTMYTVVCFEIGLAIAPITPASSCTAAPWCARASECSRPREISSPSSFSTVNNPGGEWDG